MVKLKFKLKNLIYSVGFLFRPITPVAVSFIFLAIASALLVIIIMTLNESTKAYQILLAILTGVTASLLIAIMMELFNNYRYNVKRQRELREYLGFVAGYQIDQNAIIKSNDQYEKILGNGRAYAVFWQLSKIIPNLKEALNNREYLYQKEIEEIDNILYEYDNLLKIIHFKLFGVFLDLIVDETEDRIELEVENENQITTHETTNEAIDEKELIDESLSDYPSLLKFLEKEAKRYDKKEKDSSFYDEAPKHLHSIIEKAIFLERHIFRRYFEVTDIRYELSKKIDDEEYLEDLEKDKDTGFEFRSNMISLACGDIDKSMMKLQRRVAKEPYFWTLTSYKEKI